MVSPRKGEQMEILLVFDDTFHFEKIELIGLLKNTARFIEFDLYTRPFKLSSGLISKPM
jgi:hypothetical protein